MPECVTPARTSPPPTSTPPPANLLSPLHSCILPVGFEAFVQCPRIITLLFAPHRLQLLLLLSSFPQSRHNFIPQLMSSMHTTHRPEVTPPSPPQPQPSTWKECGTRRRGVSHATRSEINVTGGLGGEGGGGWSTEMTQK
ncbi:unnamed protein product [Rodentolepis nana]|uniref:Uncharacterized protein n=1 Tax=Rodentolepis nana TaxID=102285 RepID=A0A0R3TWI9_RODNA|nr:unnamed protein product [Rodentolepis nana]